MDMYYNILMFLLFPFLLLLPFISLKQSLMLYVIGSLIFPYLHAGSLFILLELIYAVWMFVVLSLKKMLHRSPLRVHGVAVLYALQIQELDSEQAAKLFVDETSAEIDFFLLTCLKQYKGRTGL